MPDPLISYPFTEQGLRDALEALGTTDSAIATNLLGMGYRGKRGSENFCPVANYVRSSIIGAYTASVLLDEKEEPYISVIGQSGARVDSIWTYTLGEFIWQFDSGEHPELEAPDASS